MNSVFKPEKSRYGERFLKTVYAIIVKRMKIDPITEGRFLERFIQSTLFGDDFLKLSDKDERDKRLKKVNNLVDIYGKRSKKFWTVFQRYVYTRGQMRAITTLSHFLTDGEKRERQLEKQLK